MRQTAWKLGNTRASLEPYDVTRILLALVMLLAATLKTKQLVTSPVVGAGVLNSRPTLVAIVEFELLLGVWLMSGRQKRWSYRVTFVCIVAFSVVSLFKALSGAVSCGCFGAVQVNPWYTLAFDLAALFALVSWPPPYLDALCERDRIVRLWPMVLIWLALGVPAAVGMINYTPIVLSENGVSIGTDDAIVLEPEKWVGNRIPILPYVEDVPAKHATRQASLRQRLEKGAWHIVLFRHDCHKCYEEMPRYRKLAQLGLREKSKRRLVFIELPPYGGFPDCETRSAMECEFGRLDSNSTWFAQTPCEILLEQGTVVGVK